jgi:hypothetical protein
MGNRLPHGLGGRGHWVDMLGGDRGRSIKVDGEVLDRQLIGTGWVARSKIEIG